MRRTITALFVTFVTASLLATAQESKEKPQPVSPSQEIKAQQKASPPTPTQTTLKWTTKRLEGEQLEQAVRLAVLEFVRMHKAGKPYLAVFYNGESLDPIVDKRRSTQLGCVWQVVGRHNPEVLAFDLRARHGEQDYVKIVGQDDADDYRVRLKKGDVLVIAFNGKALEPPQLMSAAVGGVVQLDAYIEATLGIKPPPPPAIGEKTKSEPEEKSPPKKDK